MLGLPVTTDFSHPPECNCCRGLNAHVLSVDALSLTAKRLGLMEEQDDGEDPFLEFELALAGILSLRAVQFIPAALEIVREAFNRGPVARTDEVVTSLEVAENTYRGRGLSTRVQDEIGFIANDAITAGVVKNARTISNAASLTAEQKRVIIRGMVRSSGYYSNEYFNTQVMPQLVREVLRLASLPGDRLQFDAIRSLLDKRLRSVPYWRVVANAAMSRSFHYGMVKSAQLLGRRTYTFSAVLDNRTSDICEALHGTVWNLSDAANLLERIAKAEPGEVPEIAPWPRFSDIEPLIDDPSAMAELGVLIPPLHGNCRSTIIIN